MSLSLSKDFFISLPEDLQIESITYLSKSPKQQQESDLWLLTTALVSKMWRDDPLLQVERQKAATRLRQRASLSLCLHKMQIVTTFPGELRQLFRAHRQPMNRLAILDLGGRTGNTDYIDFLCPEEVPSGLMLFKDALGRSGIAFKLQEQGETHVQTIFQRYPGIRGLWVSGGRNVRLRNSNEACYKFPYIGPPTEMVRVVQELFEGAIPGVRIAHPEEQFNCSCCLIC